MNKLLHWVYDNIPIIGVLFLLCFIPLYPKLPLINVIRTWVYIRAEDFFVALFIGIFALQWLKNRSILKTPLTWPILCYWGAGIVVLVLSFFSGKTLLNFFPHLAILHYFRRIEYMGLFFLSSFAMRKNPRILSYLVLVLGITVLGVILYGIGQKFLGFPAYLTMNEEFAKGIPLRLPPTARIPSTFGGHYDLAAYLVLMIPILGSLVFGLRRFWQKILFLALAVGGLVLLLFTASRISFGMYIVAISTMLWWQKKKLFIIPVIILSMVLLNFVHGASERFYKTFRFSDVIIDLSTGQAVGTLEKLEGTTATIAKSESPAKENLPTGSAYIGVPPPVATPAKPTKTIKTIELYSSASLATGSGEIATVSGNFLIQKAFVYDISITTRLQGEWPHAIDLFKRNLLFGSGYSSLSVASDGDYFRMLGETGLFGTLAFLGIFCAAFVLFFKKRSELSPLPRALVIGIFAGIVGLFFNAILIDVFEASKVAYTLWLLLGIAVALLSDRMMPIGEYVGLLYRILASKIMVFCYITVFVFLVYGGALTQYFVGDDFTWLRWAASTPISGISHYFTDAGGFFYRPIPKIWYFLLYTVFWLKPFAYHVMSLLLFSLVSIELFALLTWQKVRKIIAFLLVLFFVSLSVHHESIYWISSQSHLLAICFFLGSILLGIRAESQKGLRSQYWDILSVLFLFGSLLSHDGLLAAPLIYVCIRMFLFRYAVQKAVWPILVLPLYLWMRLYSGAVPPSGDYNYKLTSFLPNSIGNIVGYVAAAFFGPRIVEQFAILRSSLRSFVLPASGVLSGLLLLMIFFWNKHRKKMPIGKTFFWVLGFVVILLPFAGLGGMAERYALFGTPFLFMALGTGLEGHWQKIRGYTKGLLVAGVFLLMFWNIRELNRLGREWKFASDVSEQTALTMRKAYFPLADHISFVFVNVPIRYGRAWIYPTGLTDALWHIFKFNPYPYEVFAAKTVPEGFAIKTKYGATVLVFENYVLKKAIKEIKTIEVDIGK